MAEWAAGLTAMNLSLGSKITELHKIGQALSGRLKRLGIETVKDLFFYFPFRYDDFSLTADIGKIEPGMTVTARGRLEMIANKRSKFKRKLITEGLLADATGTIKIIWFNQPWISKSLRVNQEYLVSGKTAGDMFNVYFNSPACELATAAKSDGGIIAIYPLTEGVSQKQIRFLIKNSVALMDEVREYLPADLVKKYGLLDLPSAIWQIHFPRDQQEIAASRRRLAFEELFLPQLIRLAHKKILAGQKARPLRFFEDKIKEFVNSLPFDLTLDQKRAAWEIVKDLQKDRPMNRLLDGDVGSGKTLVAMLAMYDAALNDAQAALMAPTEILASQHYHSFRAHLERFGLRVGLLTGNYHSLGGTEVSRQEFLKLCHRGEIDVIIGTHALIQEGVKFRNLSLAVVDEQHRFGVEQRAALRQKAIDEADGQPGFSPHFLSLTATPIPRSLALAIYSDLDLSVIKEMPKGRRQIVTRAVGPEKRQVAYDYISRQIDAGRQVFVICPLIDPSDKLGVRSVKEEFEKLDQEVFPHLAVGLLHGRLKSDEKEQVMAQFLKNEIKILVSTSVVEVGVDVPNAAVMMIEGAERFGLAQLHQFRGRVGRGEHQSYCFLFSDALGDESLSRLKFMETCQDGFALAQKDLDSRGAGSFWGREQSGFTEFKLADMSDAGLIKAARDAAGELLEKYDLADFPQLKERMKLGDFVEHGE